ncbi:MAG: hypothetical protein JWO81_3260 [Alphaproteobacteria bacterium]|nr:hypothetical protein [Alphaproteobacteria bacterium]
MDAPTRRTRFEERVRVEREFLLPVNMRFGAEIPLAGMTADAIESWRRRAATAGIGVDVERAAALLREASARAELLADNSRDVFEADRCTGPDGMAELRRMLVEMFAN